MECLKTQLHCDLFIMMIDNRITCSSHIQHVVCCCSSVCACCVSLLFLRKHLNQCVVLLCELSLFALMIHICEHLRSSSSGFRLFALSSQCACGLIFPFIFSCTMKRVCALIHHPSHNPDLYTPSCALLCEYAASTRGCGKRFSAVRQFTWLKIYSEDEFLPFVQTITE